MKVRAAFMCFAFLGLAGELVVVGAKQFNRYDFPPGFVFGAGTSAYQVEGATFEDGRKASIFDTFLHSGNGDIACDEYHKYKEDIQLMVETGLDAYRFSISWSRLLPDGKGHINPMGLEYYNNLINGLIKHGIQPHVTLVHSDLPQVLEDEYGGFISSKIIKDFTAYADVCFQEFGDRVMYWTTVNEANIFVLGGYDIGGVPPTRCSSPFGTNCTKGNSTSEPYLAAHNILLSHASIARLYKEKYEGKQHGFVGLGLYSAHFIPSTTMQEDIIAAQRSYDSLVGWFMHPLTYGDYPAILKRNAGTRIPSFNENESKLVKGAIDFIGLNYYNVFLVKDISDFAREQRDFLADMGGKWLFLNDNSSEGGGVPSGDPFINTPWGLEGVLEYFKQSYNNPPIFILENGQATNYNVGINDPPRIQYLQAHIGALLDAVRNGSNTKGYFVWSFLDVIEMFGNRTSFGLYYVDFNHPNLTRYPKLSQRWYSMFLKGGNVTIDDEGNQAKRVPNIVRIRPFDADSETWQVNPIVPSL